MLPESLLVLMKTIRTRGYEVYIVGGAVRDHLMGRSINDYDLTTSAKPEVIQKLFKKTVDIGIDFGTVQVNCMGDIYEVTTYRQDSLKSDGRKPDFVSYTSDVMEDLARRDFTVNAMIMDHNCNIQDPYNGKDSIKSRVLYTVGDPSQRFKEDYLRVYRYVRLNQILGFKRNPLIDNVITSMPINTNISFERIREELNKILLSNHPSKAMVHMKSIGLLGYVIPGIQETYGFDQASKYHHLNVFDHSMAVLDATPADLVSRLSGLLHDIGKPPTFQKIEGEGHFYGHDKTSQTMAVDILRRLKYPNHIINRVGLIVGNHMRLLDSSNLGSLRKFIRKIGQENIQAWFNLRKADIMACRTQESLKDIRELEIIINDLLNEVPALSVNDLDISGYDLMELGYQGKVIGKIKKYLLDKVDQDPSFNKKDKMIQYIQSSEEEWNN